jgi:predicted nucleic acid-binding protein
MIHVVDAHVLIWYLEGSPKLTAAAEAILDDPASNVVVPTIALAEIWHRHHRGKIRASLADARALIDSLSNAVIAPFDEPVLNLLPAGMEIHDAIIVAAALVLGASGSVPVRVVTRDQQITASGLVNVLW